MDFRSLILILAGSLAGGGNRLAATGTTAERRAVVVTARASPGESPRALSVQCSAAGT